MAYVLGFFAADGAMTKGKRGNHFIEFTSCDKPLLFEMRWAMNSEHKIAVSHKENGERCFRLQIGSKEIYEDLTKLGFVRRKSMRMKLPEIPDEYLSHFVRGYFDGDGHIWFGASHKERKTPGIQMHSVFTSGSKGFLKSLSNKLSELGINGSLCFYGGGHRLIYSIRASLSLYEFMYNNATLYLPRKKVKFEEYMKLRA